MFKPAFLGRLNLIPYLPLDDDKLALITKLQLARIQQRLQQHYRADFTYSDEVIGLIVSQCQDAGAGARTIHNILQNQLLPELSVRILQRVAENQPINALHLAVEEATFSYQLH